MAEPTRGFRVPPEVPRYFAEKSLKPRFSWLDVWAEEHAHSFTVAKAVELDLLKTFKSSIERAIDTGQGFESWRKELAPELQRLGWWGKRRVADPDGRDKPATVDFSSPRRLQRIFDSNMRSARAAGQWERIQRTKRALPYLLYVRTTSAEPRAEHLRWAGLILPVDDPFWRTHFPPNGWGCKCAVRQVMKREADERLAQPGYSGTSPAIETRTFRNRRTGGISQVPEGIDPGWATNPGLARAQTLVTRMQERLEEAGPEVAKRAIGELLQTPAPRILMGLDERVRLPIAISARMQDQSGARSPLITVSNDTIRTKAEKHPAVTTEALALVQPLVERGLAQPNRSGARSFLGWARRQLWRAVIRPSADGFLYLSTLHPVGKRRLRGESAPVIEDETSEDEAAAGST